MDLFLGDDRGLGEEVFLLEQPGQCDGADSHGVMSQELTTRGVGVVEHVRTSLAGPGRQGGRQTGQADRGRRIKPLP